MATDSMPDNGLQSIPKTEYRSLNDGLRTEDVEKRIREGRVNTAPESTGKSVKQIFFSNLITFFNLLNVVFFVLILVVGS